MRHVTIAAGLVLASVCGAYAQAPVLPPQNPAETAPVDPSETGATLSEKLQKSDGVIRPPVTATPDMRVPAPVPEPNTTPVIPPPGSPGSENPKLDPR